MKSHIKACNSVDTNAETTYNVARIYFQHRLGFMDGGGEIYIRRATGMNNILHAKIEEIPTEHSSTYEGYEYYRRRFTPFGFAEQCDVSIYEIPPGNSMCPYHYHAKNEETFYIISGKGLLKTPTDEKEISSGEILFFPGNENGAHKLTNISDTEMLVYLDFGTRNEIDVAFYPDSGKIGVWGKNINKVYKENQNVDYYDGE